MKILISSFTLIIQFSNVHSNPCQWLNNGVGCTIQCRPGGSSSNSISGHVQTVYDEIPDCHTTGVKLFIPNDVTGYTLKPNWLLVDIHLIELEIDATIISEFKPNVFASTVFASVKKLHLKNIQLLSWEDDIQKSILTGLDSLEDLSITNSAVKIYNNGWLDNINGTIKSLLITGSGSEAPLDIEKLTGGTARSLMNIDYVKIQYNLTQFVNYRSFTAIPNVRELDLSDCSISVIKEFSFEKLGSKLEVLNLQRNRLTTLPPDIFSSFYFSSGVTVSSLAVQSDLVVRLSGNLWHCDCSIIHLKELLIANSNFDGEILCNTPDEIVNYPMKETEFCPLPITTDSTTESTTIPIDNDNNNEKYCPPHSGGGSPIKIFIQPRIQRVELNGTANNGVLVILEKYSTDFLLIWFKSEKFTNGFEYHRNANASDCFANLSAQILINDLQESTSYTFCLMNISQLTVSPFDCISYYNHGNNEEKLRTVWLYSNSKPLTIFLIAIACIANIIVGILIGAIFLKFNGYETFNFRLVCQCWNDDPTVQEAINPYFFGASSKNTDSDRPPPLPPHPLKQEEHDVYYATIKE